MVILGILLILAGLTMLIRPAAVWALAESWKSNDATEPSDLYLFSTRFGGGMCTLAGLAALILPHLV
jgi:hypothetical protein